MDDEYYHEWIDINGRSSFELAPLASALILSFLFVWIGSWTFCVSRNVADSLGLALGAIALGCIGLSVGATWEDDGQLLVPCDSPDAVEGNLGIGILLGAALAMYGGVVRAIAFGRRTRRLQTQAYADQGEPLAGIVVQKSQKSNSTSNDTSNNSYIYFLHVRYKLRGSPSIGGGGPQSETAQWSYRLDKEDYRWTNYDENSNATLERAFQEKKRFSPAIMASNIVDFSAMLQTDASTGLRQAVKRTTRDDNTLTSALWHDDETPYPEPPPATPGYESENVHPFPVTKATYDREAVGSGVDMLSLPGNPFFVALKSELKPLDGSEGFVSFIVSILFCWPLPLMLGFYLPARILNFHSCRTSLIVGLSTMFATSVFLHLWCCCRCRPKGSLTHEEAREIVQQARDKLVAGLNDEERELSYNRQKIAVLASLEDVVARQLEDSPNDYGARTTQSGLLALGRVATTKQQPVENLFVLTRIKLLTWINFAMYQADVSGNRVLPGTTVVK